MNIIGKRVVLRAMEPDDSKLICDMFNSAEIEHSVVGWSFPLSIYGQEKWIDSHANDVDQRFIIQDKEYGAVGVVTLVDIDWKNRMAQHGIKMIDGKCRGKGIATDAVMALMRYSFDELGLNRLNGSWFPDNAASRCLYKKCGWTEEGTRRNYIYKNGAFKDLIESGILADEYYELIRSNNYWE